MKNLELRMIIDPSSKIAGIAHLMLQDCSLKHFAFRNRARLFDDCRFRSHDISGRESFQAASLKDLLWSNLVDCSKCSLGSENN